MDTVTSSSSKDLYYINCKLATAFDLPSHSFFVRVAGKSLDLKQAIKIAKIQAEVA